MWFWSATSGCGVGQLLVGVVLVSSECGVSQQWVWCRSAVSVVSVSSGCGVGQQWVWRQSAVGGRAHQTKELNTQLNQCTQVPTGSNSLQGITSAPLN